MSAESQELRERVARVFWEAEAVKVDFDQPFELASGNRSPIYVNCRLLISDAAFMSLYVEAANAVLAAAEVEFDAVAGGETAGIPYAAYLAQASGRSMLYVRKQAKGYGIASRVEGRLKSGWQVLLVEDLITDGDSKLGFVEALRAGGGEVTDALVLFDRQQGGERVLGDHGVRLHSVTDRATTLAVGQSLEVLTATQREEIDRYFTDPALWHAARDLAFEPA
jgi:orotate phosphoribosyltransferase